MVDRKCGFASISRPDTTASDENKVEMPLRFDPMTIALVAHNRAARAVFDSWGYRTTRSLGTVCAIGYFEGLRGLKVGDGIRVTRISTDGRRLLDSVELVVAEVPPSVRVIALQGATLDDLSPCHRRI